MKVSLATAVTLVLALAASAAAAPNVWFSPGQVMLGPGESAEISFRIDDCGIPVSGYQLYLSFDPSVVELVSATEGTLYANSSDPTWFIPEEEEPGVWHFFDVLMGSGTSVLPPGELLHLRFEASGEGATEIHIDSILLADVERENLPVGSYEHGYMCVVPTTGVEEGGDIASIGPGRPNPFVSGTAVSFHLPDARVGAEIEIFDVSGRLVRRLPIPEGRSGGVVTWDGRDTAGRALPSSVYFAHLSGASPAARCRLVKID